MKKIIAIFECLLFILGSIILATLFPSLVLFTYVEEGFGFAFILIAIITIFAEPLTIAILYSVLTSVKEIYNNLYKNIKEN